MLGLNDGTDGMGSVELGTARADFCMIGLYTLTTPPLERL